MKKLISLLLALAMVASLAACGGGATSTPSTPSTPSTSTPATPSTPAEPSKPAEPSTPAEPSKPAEPVKPAEPTKITLGIPFSAKLGSYEDNDYTNWLEETANVEIEFVFYDSANWQTQLAASVAANEKLPDILYNMEMDAVLRETYGIDGYLTDLLPYFEGDQGAGYRERCEYLYGEGAFESIMAGMTSSDGGVYGVPYVSGQGEPSPYVYINKAWLDKLGLEEPTTWDELVNVLRAFKTKDPNGNGKADEIPMFGALNPNSGSRIDWWLIGNWIYCIDSYMFNVDDNGQLYLPYTTDEYRQAMIEIAKLVDEGLLSDLTWTIQDLTEVKALWTPADNTALVGVIANHALTGLAENSPLIHDYDALMPLGYGFPGAMNFGRCWTYITTDAENPEACFDLLMLFATGEGYMRGQNGVPGRDWDYVKDDKGNIIGRRNTPGVTAKGEGTTITWGHTPHCTLMNTEVETQYASSLPADKSEWAWTDYRSNKTASYNAEIRAFLAANNRTPKNYIDYAMTYNQEELDLIGTADVDVKTYIQQARAQFLTGVRDASSDADWNKYLKELDGLGVANYLKASQSSYDRRMGK